MKPAKPKTILVVDDEEALVEAAVDFLSSAGFNVLTAHNGAAALATLRAHEPIDLILTDMKMPVMDGAALLKVVRQEFAHIPVYIVSGGSNLTESEVLSLGAAGYISKPFSFETLIACANHDTIDSLASSRKPSATPIFILEDETLDQELLKISFSKHEWSEEVELRYFQDGQSLIDQLRSKEPVPELLVLDINLPGISGLETLEKVRQLSLIPNSTKVIILSSSTRQSDKDLAKNLMVDSFYPKPTERAAWWHLARAIYQSWIRKNSDDSLSTDS
ncbi:MAG: response regulator [Proteobacteria bacterium]|nr:response regulator [Pseudomonadota bacterium]